MNTNLGNFIVDDIVLADYGNETIIDYITSLTFYFDHGIPVRITQIITLNLLKDNHIFIEGAIFSPSLYNAYQQNRKITKIVETGVCINPLNTDNEAEYVTEYYNYNFKEFTFTRSREDNRYSFILQPISDLNNADN